MTATQEHTPEQAKKPWGRFTLLFKEVAEDNDHISFTNEVTTIGRNKRRCDLVINKLFISSVHCVVRLDGTDDTGKPIVKLDDNSRNGIWVNGDRVGKGASVKLGSGFTVHFTKPGTTPAGVTPMVYKFEFLNFHGSLPVSPECKVNEAPEDADMTVVTDESIEATQLTASADPPSPSEKKRKRMDEDPEAVTVVTQELESELEATKRQLKVVESKLKAAQVDKLAKENLDLMVKLEASIAENLQLKTDLAAKDKDMEAKIREATTKSLEAASEKKAKLKEEAVMKEKVMEMKIKQSLTKSFEADCEAKSQEMAVKLKEATKKYQQKVEAEHYEQRREMSEKMASFANENEKLQTILGVKDEELAECRDQIASLRDKITALEGKVTILSAKAKSIAELEEKIADLEEKLTVSKSESAEIFGLLTAAEEKIVAVENKVAEADIAAAATTHANANNCTDASELHELQKSISSLRGELETYRVQLPSREEEHRTSMTATAPASIAAESIARGEDAEALRDRLAAALNLFSQVQALGLQGARLTTMTNSSELGDLHLLSAASVESERDNSMAVLNSPSSVSTEDGQHNGEGDPKDSFEEKTAKKSAKKTAKDCISKAKAERAEESVDGAAEPKRTSSKLKREKKSNKQVALSETIEADAASAIAAMASVKSNGKQSLGDASDEDANADGEGDWEMLE